MFSIRSSGWAKLVCIMKLEVVSPNVCMRMRTHMFVGKSNAGFLP